MVGKIRFDRGEALAAATRLFWRKGFNGTSLEDLKAATGINESSLYNTFGSKKELYKEALSGYFEKVVSDFAALPVRDKPLESIRTVLTRIATQRVGRERAAGCMLMNTALELGAEHKDLAEFARKKYQIIEDWMCNAVECAQAKGEIPKDKDARQLARFLTYSVQSMMTIARTKPSREFMDDILKATLSVLE